MQTAIRFAKAIREKAGISCEIFPSGKRSKCLKWPLSVHPETGRVEVFVPLDDLDNTEWLDTPVILQTLFEGYYRTPSNVIETFVGANTKKPKVSVSIDDTQPDTEARSVSNKDTQPDTEPKTEGHWLEIFNDEQAGFRLLGLFGKHTRATRLGQAFKCPVHPERRPSATFIKDSNGFVAFHDWHWEKYGLESDFFTLPELYHALKTGSELRRLDRREQAASAKELAFLLAYTNPLVEEISSKWLESTRILLKLGVITNLIFKRLVTTPTPKDWLKALNLNGLSDFERVWVICFWCFIQDAMDGKAVTVMSKRFVGERTGVKYWQVNRTLNLLCTLGLLEKCEVVKHGKRLGAHRFRLCKASEAEVRRRFELLFPDGKIDLRQFKASLVAERLGEEVAAAVFRRQAGTVKEAVSRTCHESTDIHHESADNHHVTRLELLASIRAAEEAGRWEEMERLLRLYMEEIRRNSSGELSENSRKTYLFPRGTPGEPPGNPAYSLGEQWALAPK